MKLSLFFVFLGICGVALTIPTTIYQQNGNPGVVADKVFLEKQKDILRLLMHVTQPSFFIDQVQLGKSFDIEQSLDSFTNVEAVKEFIGLYKAGLLTRGEIFTISNEFHERQVIALFHVFYYAKDYETFYKAACWARNYVNEGMFVYAFNVAILHRPDCKGLSLPAPYEVYPFYFVNSDVITKARRSKLQNFALYRPDVIKSLMKDPSLAVDAKSLPKQEYDALIQGKYVPDYKTPFEQTPLMPVERTPEGAPVVSIPSNYSEWYLNMDYEQSALTYFTEDIGLNSYYYYFNLDYPFWMKGVKYGLQNDRRGELYYYIHQQILARYYLERLSNGLGSVDLINPSNTVQTGYVCVLQYENGIPFPIRPRFSDVITDDKSFIKAKAIEFLEKRIIDAIDAGYVITDEGKKVSLYTQEGINILGNLIAGNADSVHPRYFRSIAKIAQILVGYSGSESNSYHLVPSALEHYETAMRDPAFYSIYKRILHYFIYYKQNLPAYKYTDLLYPGVKIQSIVLDKLVTYFDYFDIDLTNAINTDFTVQSAPRVLVKARQMRLNHLPYNYKINVVSDKVDKAIVRVFLGPKYNEMGQEMTLKENRINFIELDKFVTDLKVGQNVIERSSRQAYHTVQDRTTYFELYRKVMMSLQGKEEYIADNSEAHCGFPNRLLLPKGRQGGMPYKLFVIISPYKCSEPEAQALLDHQVTCGVGSGLRYIDNLPMGYPLDRPINPTQWSVPNMYVQEVNIFHKKYEEVINNY